jgi:hypothetical protein
LARLHGGTIEVKNRDDVEHGVRAVLSLPLAEERFTTETQRSQRKLNDTYIALGIGGLPG